MAALRVWATNLLPLARVNGICIYKLVGTVGLESFSTSVGGGRVDETTRDNFNNFRFIKKYFDSIKYN
jgi:hypothetical protein